ncbi:MAG: lipoate--protein ligase [Bacteroidales bacterium]|nr:lipoate--protein ligase [Bacteroidales bacterium]
MLYIIDHSTDPQWNLAAEEYLFRNFTDPVFRLWRNRASVIIGLHQNAFAEINTNYVREHNIPVVRRLSGGGAVFHDLGNLNFTFIDNSVNSHETSSEMFARFTRPIIEALTLLGIEATLKGRNDLVIDDMKFSGNAVALYKNRILQHGTLLFSSSMANLSDALANRPEQYDSKAVKSNRARVTNISDHLEKKMTIEEFILFMERFILSQREGKYIQYSYSSEDLAKIAKIKLEKYSRDSWNYGSSPQFEYSKVRRFEGGLLEVYMTVKRGIIQEIRFYGNYFFKKESRDLEQILIGTPCSLVSVADTLKRVNLSDYFVNITEEEFLSMLF